MKDKKVLNISSEVVPYLPQTNQAISSFKIPKNINDHGGQTRIFMPRYGLINERRHQLHEVIRLSGMNLVINDVDMPLIIKVASIPKERMQVYFIDNDEYFKRRAILRDENEKLFDDNDERMIFFCRGVLETLQMLGWSPDIIHCHGWFTSLLPVYLKEGADEDGNKLYYNHPVFKNTKIISSFHNEGFTGSLNKSLVEKMKFDGFEDSLLETLKTPNHQALISLASRFSDGIVFESEYKNDEQLKLAYKENTPVLESTDYTQYYNFYQNFFSEELV